MSDPSFIREIDVKYKGPRMSFGDNCTVTSSRDVDRFARGKLKIATSPVECFYMLPLDAKNHVLGYHLLAKGGTSFCAISMADMFRPLIACGALGFVAIHNHPSGEPTPSPDDIALTSRIEKIAIIMGIRLVDHIIIGDPEYFSFLDAGLIQVKS